MSIEAKVPAILHDWLAVEYDHARAKFGSSQSEVLQAHGLTSEMNFGGQTALYWSRFHTYDGSAPMHQAQYAAKMASCTRSLWATLRSLDWSDNSFAVHLGADLIEEHLIESGIYSAKNYIDTHDFYETPVGIGLGYLAEKVKAHGFDSKFRLGYLLRAQSIMEDASDVAALQFARTLDVVGDLPRPGLSSGNIEPWGLAL